MEDPSDQALLLQYNRSHDRDALSELVRRRWPDAYRLALKALGDPAAAEDVAQDAFVALIHGAGRFDSSRPFGPWFRTLVMNAARNNARSRRRRQRHEERCAEKLVGLTKSPEGETRLQAAELDEHLLRLPFKVRFPMILHFFEGCSHDEVGVIVGCPKETARSRINRGLEQLRTSLAGVGCVVSVAQVETWFASSRASSLRGTIPIAPTVAVVETATKKGLAKALATKLLASALLIGLAGGATIRFVGSRATAAPLASVSSIEREQEDQRVRSGQPVEPTDGAFPSAEPSLVGNATGQVITFRDGLMLTESTPLQVEFSPLDPAQTVSVHGKVEGGVERSEPMGVAARGQGIVVLTHVSEGGAFKLDVPAGSYRVLAFRKTGLSVPKLLGGLDVLAEPGRSIDQLNLPKPPKTD